MATVLEELLIKIGFDVDQKGLKKAQESIKGDLQSSGKEAKAQGKKNKGLRDQEDALDGIIKKKDESRKQNESTDDDEAVRLDRQKNVNKVLNDAKGLLGGLSKGWIAAGVAAGAYTANMAKGNDSLAKFSRGLGVPSDEFQQWEFAAGMTGSSSEALRGTISNLTGIIGGFRQGLSELPMGMSMLGIIPKEGEDAIDLLERIGEASKKLTSEKRFTILTSIGIDPTLINVLSEERLERDKLLRQGSLGVETSEQLISSEEFYDESLTLWRGIKDDTAGTRKAATDIVTSIFRLINKGREHRGAPLPGARQQDLESALLLDKLPWRVDQNVNINIDGAQDPDNLAITIKKVLTDEYRNAGDDANKSGVN